jgi:hypothetical protein
MAVTPPGRRKPPKRPNQERIDHLNALATLHDEWVAANADGAGFDPKGRPARSDYNIHHVDLDATPEAADDFAAKAAALLPRRGAMGGG